MDVVDAVVRHIGSSLQDFDGDHLSRLPLHGRFAADVTNVVGFVDVGAGRKVRGAALQDGELDGTGLVADLFRDHVRQDLTGTGQLSVAEGVDEGGIVTQFADESAVRQLDALRDGDDDGLLDEAQVVDPVDERLGVEGDFRQVDEVRAVAVRVIGEHGRSGQPAGVTTHDLDDAEFRFGCTEGLVVADDLLHRGGDELGGGAVARRVVGHRKVVVDGFRDTDEFLVFSVHRGIVGQLLDGVHGVVTADVQEVFDVVLLHKEEHLLIGGFVAFDLRQLVTAGAEEGGRCSLQEGQFVEVVEVDVEVDDIVIEETLDAVVHTVHFFDAMVFCRADGACQARVDDRGGTAGLSNNHITHYA